MFAETKAHSRAIDLELRRMETEEAQQHIQYLLAYMPDSFMSLGGTFIIIELFWDLSIFILSNFNYYIDLQYC